MTNLLPAILLAAPPHSGKSVLAFKLSERLRAASVQHVVLRAAPDGEGDWSFQCPNQVRLRLRRKGEFTPNLVSRMRRAIQNRNLPLLVDAGGRPQQDQFGLIDDCTHVIHLWREEVDRGQWQRWLHGRSLIPIAELQSRLHGPEELLDEGGVLRGSLADLDRAHPHTGPVFDRLAERVQGICTYATAELEARHLAQGPAGAPVLTMSAAAKAVGAYTSAGEIWFEPRHIAPVLDLTPAGQPLALYGRWPMWLVAALAAHTAPAPCHWFDARHYGWMEPPPVQSGDGQANPEFTLTPRFERDHVRLVFAFHHGDAVLWHYPVRAPDLPNALGVVFDGKMPGWLWAALARHYRHHPWLAAANPRQPDFIRFAGQFEG